MKRIVSTAILCGALAGFSCPRAGALELGSSPTYGKAAAMARDSDAAQTSSSERAHALSGRMMDGNGARGAVYTGDATQRSPHFESATSYGRQPSGDLKADAKEVPSPKGEEKKDGLPSWAYYAGAAVLGGLQGFFTGGPLGAAAGAAMGLAGAHMFKKGNYGASFGLMGGALLGAAIGGPVGALLGAAIGGLLGHFVGKLFKK